MNADAQAPRKHDAMANDLDSTIAEVEECYAAFGKLFDFLRPQSHGDDPVSVEAVRQVCFLIWEDFGDAKMKLRALQEEYDAALRRAGAP